jgi:TPR repeat protein
MVQLGRLLAERDPDAARDWLEQAADAGHIEAMVYLGLLLEESEPDTAREWCRRARRQGRPPPDVLT